MISDRTVRAGTVLHFDFRALRGVCPEFYDAHPVVVISPTVRQTDRTAVVVPLTSEVSNATNPSAVEIFHAELNRRSPTGRTFAVCNLPVALALKRPSLQYYRREGRNPSGDSEPPHYELRGEDLSRVRAKVVEHFYTTAGLRTDAGLSALIGVQAPARAGAEGRSIPKGHAVRAKLTPRMVLKKLLPLPGINGWASRPARPLLRSTGPLPSNPRPVAGTRRASRPPPLRPLQ